MAAVFDVLKYDGKNSYIPSAQRRRHGADAVPQPSDFMPIQLPIVICQTARQDHLMRQFEESLVAELVMTEAADVRLIGALDRLVENTSDQLLLEGIAGEFVLMSWLPPQQALTRLIKLGIPGRRAAHSQDSQPPQASGRAIYFIELTHRSDIASLIELIRRCSLDRSTTTLGIGSLGRPVKLNGSRATTQRTPSSSEQSVSEHNTSEPASTIDDDRCETGPQPAVDSAQSAAMIDALVDELDQWDR